jgi:hypothetical protein
MKKTGFLLLVVIIVVFLSACNDDIDWSKGGRSTFTEGKYLYCKNLAKGQLYGIVFYNNSKPDHEVEVNVQWGSPQR